MFSKPKNQDKQIEVMARFLGGKFVCWTLALFSFDRYCLGISSTFVTKTLKASLPEKR